MTDHKAAAEARMYRVESKFIDDPKSQFVITATLASAQVHATLYLAEQQRIANLIALCESDWAGSLGLTLSEELVKAVRETEGSANG